MIIFWLFGGLVVIFGFVVAFGAPYVPSLKKEVRAAFKELYEVGPNDTVVDLGSGDGAVLLEATHLGAYGYGYELNPILVLISKFRLGKKASIQLGDMWNTTLPEATTLVYVFAVSRDSRRLGKYLQVQASKQQRTVRVMTFGTGLVGFTAIATRKAHSLYEIRPLQVEHA